MNTTTGKIRVALTDPQQASDPVDVGEPVVEQDGIERLRRELIEPGRGGAD